ncbi:MAG: ABC transporter permease subunit [Elusimicrobia bacterium]|nr:ABC transporter permease subunit [Elusimicrobiota bacterium]MBU2614665.1 ABC transporter permease subunit [Elusimicrobiota bacterium]
MSLYTSVAKNSVERKVVLAVIYTLLILGSISMIYPLLLVVSWSISSPVDVEDLTVLPKYLYQDKALYQKYVCSKYWETMDNYNDVMRTEYIKFKDIQPVTAPIKSDAVFKDWQEFKKTLPTEYLLLGHSYAKNGLTPAVNFSYIGFLKKKYKSLNSYNLLLNEKFPGWMDAANIAPERWFIREYFPIEDIRYRDYCDFKKELPDQYFQVIAMEGKFQRFLRVRYGKIDKLNNEWGTKYKSFLELTLNQTLPSNPKEAKYWKDFVEKVIPIWYISFISDVNSSYRNFVKSKYGNDLKILNQDYGTNYKSYADVVLPEKIPYHGLRLIHYIEFIEKVVPISNIRLTSGEFKYKEFLKNKYHSIESLNAAYQMQYNSFSQITPFLPQFDWKEVQENKFKIRWTMVTKNYREVFGLVLIHGRALTNTIFVCVCFILLSITVNPLAAYALSRFKLKSSYTILLLMLVTMAFPAEVTDIPGFLLTKQLGLLNTYIAILLPGAAAGYSIFLLKGFFDSLPMDFYDSAVIEGASELWIFRKITFPLCKPILAVTVLSAFTAMYGSWTWALVVCQDPNMWTLMVWLFELQSWAPRFVVSAALIISAVPPLILFIFMQKVILRGIIIPVFK